MSAVNLAKYTTGDYQPGRGFFFRIMWYCVNMMMFKTSLPLPYTIKVSILRFFGAKIGKKCVIKPCVNIKFPWRLQLGDNVWIGENVWIDNLVDIIISNNVCISQGALLLTGNHNYNSESFDLIPSEIRIESGCWVCAKCVVCPGSYIEKNAVLQVGSVAKGVIASSSIYGGVPAKFIRKRNINI